MGPDCFALLLQRVHSEDLLLHLKQGRKKRTILKLGAQMVVTHPVPELSTLSIPGVAQVGLPPHLEHLAFLPMLPRQRVDAFAVILEINIVRKMVVNLDKFMGSIYLMLK